jgi:hypothetical protein
MRMFDPVLTIALILPMTFIGACASRYRATADEKHDAEVIREVLATIGATKESAEYLVAAMTDPHRSWLQLNTSSGYDFRIPESLAIGYANANREPRQIPVNALPSHFRLVDPSELHRFFENGPREGWEAVQAAYGMRIGIVRMSYPTYSLRRDQALITYSYDYGPLGGKTDYVILHRDNEKWKIVATGHIMLS